VKIASFLSAAWCVVLVHVKSSLGRSLKLKESIAPQILSNKIKCLKLEFKTE